MHFEELLKNNTAIFVVIIHMIASSLHVLQEIILEIKL